MTLTDRDLDIIETLARRVRLLYLEHAVKLWWPECANDRTARRRLESLQGHGWIERHVVNVAPAPSAFDRLFAWRPGEEAPDLSAIAKRLCHRRRQAARPTEILTATPSASALMGSSAHGVRTPGYRDHDAHLAAIYVLYRTTKPNLAKDWVGEQALPKGLLRRQTPNAILQRPDGTPYGLIHIPGRWNPSQLESFHASCHESGLPYELW
jgi:hypothetical protein